ncbi:hypothetical protein GCM10009639_23910 [Kitasatospora putterlickiae]|uniref:Uncharacterized protein n=1 Tax=Kitasatospora putterlickiae TaxID=221725 RepID=A0ABP4IKA3_9ACTN
MAPVGVPPGDDGECVREGQAVGGATDARSGDHHGAGHHAERDDSYAAGLTLIAGHAQRTVPSPEASGEGTAGSAGQAEYLTTPPDGADPACREPRPVLLSTGARSVGHLAGRPRTAQPGNPNEV